MRNESKSYCASESRSLLNFFFRMDTAKVGIGASAALKAKQERVSKSALLERRLAFGETSRIRGSIPGACSICGCRRATSISKLLCVKLLIGLDTLYKDRTGSAPCQRKRDRHQYWAGARASKRSLRNTLKDSPNGAATQSNFVPS